MDKRRTLLNVGVSVAFKIIVLVASILARRAVIQYLGNDINGLNSLYSSLVGFLSVAELGIGTAIAFCMYEPIVNQENDKVAALYQLFVKAYRIVGVSILVIGIGVQSILPYIAKDYAELSGDFNGTFLIMVVSVALSYTFSAKVSLINAYKNNYITTTISSGGLVLQYVLQMIVACLTRSFVWFLVCRIIAMLFQWVMIELYTYRHHSIITTHNKQTLDVDTKKKIINNVKALFIHRIGGILVNSADSIIISAYIGVVILGKYSNYTTIAISMSSVIALFFTPLTSTIGQKYVSDKDKIVAYFERFYLLNYVLGVVFFLGYYAVIDNVITILFGDNLLLSKPVSFVITLNYFVQYMRQATLLFRDATGTFYHDRWKPIIEGGLKVLVSLVFLNLFNETGDSEFGVIGVMVATLISSLSICHVIEPFVLYRYAFKKPVAKYVIKNYCYVALFAVILAAMSRCLLTYENDIIEMVINAVVSLIFSVFVLGLVLLANKGICKEVPKIVRKRKG